MSKKSVGFSNRIALLIVSSLTAAAVLPRIPCGFAAGRVVPAAGPLVSDKDVASLVDDRIERWQPTGKERRIDQIGWARDIRHALHLAKEHNRPVLLFTHEGKINIGRC